MFNIVITSSNWQNRKLFITHYVYYNKTIHILLLNNFIISVVVFLFCNKNADQMTEFNLLNKTKIAITKLSIDLAIDKKIIQINLKC